MKKRLEDILEDRVNINILLSKTYVNNYAIYVLTIKYIFFFSFVFVRE